MCLCSGSSACIRCDLQVDQLGNLVVKGSTRLIHDLQSFSGGEIQVQLGGAVTVTADSWRARRESRKKGYQLAKGRQQLQLNNANS